MDSLGLYLSPKHLLNFLSNCYMPLWFGKTFKFLVFILLENTFANKSLNLVTFTHIFHAKLSPRFVSSPSRQRKITLRDVKMRPKLNL